MKMYQGLTFFLFALLGTNTLAANELNANETTVEVEIITAPPTVMNVTFAQAVTLAAMTIKNNNGYILNLDVQVPKEKSQMFSFDIPTLQPADYIVLWHILDNNNTDKKGSFKLTVQNENSYPRPSTKQQKYGILHAKLHH